MSNVWVVRLSRVIESVCSVFMSVGVIQCNVCMLPSVFSGDHAGTL